MKNILILLFLSIAFYACKKDATEPEPVLTVQEQLIGVDWVLAYGRVYVENLDSESKYYYDHFGNAKQESNLDIFGGSPLPIDELIQDVTEWKFGNEKFVLKGGEYFYDYTTFGDSVLTVIGLENGSARPIVFNEISETMMTVTVHEGYESNAGENFFYFSTLTFIKKGTLCQNCQPDVLPGYIYGGIISPIQDNSSIGGTVWVITKYVNNFATQFPADTLRFYDFDYTINGGSPRPYNLTGGFGNNMATLTLYACSTFGGDYSGLVPRTFLEDGEMNNITFEEVFNSNRTVIAWLIKL